MRPFALSLLLLALVLSACGNPDRPIMSSAQAPTDRGEGLGIDGRVSNPEGRPVAGASVHAESLDRPAQAIPERSVYTMEDGRYEWPLLPGSYRISVQAEGYRSASGKADVRPGQRSTLDFVLVPAR